MPTNDKQISIGTTEQQLNATGHAPRSYNAGLIPQNSRNMHKAQAISSGNMRPNSLNEVGFQPMQSQTPVGHGGTTLTDAQTFNQQIMANRKAKFMQHQASKSSNPNNSQMLAQGNNGKHKVNLSTDMTVPQMANN